MNNYKSFYQPPTVLLHPRTRETLQSRVGGVARTNKTMRLIAERENSEALMMQQANAALRDERATNQREHRRSKRIS